MLPYSRAAAVEKGHDHALVLAGLAAARALGGEHAQHVEGHVVQQDALAHRVGAVGEQRGLHALADHRDLGQALFVALVEEDAARGRPLQRLLEVGGGAAALGAVVHVAAPRDHEALDVGHGHAHVGQAADGVDVGQRELAAAPARAVGNGGHVHLVGAEQRDLLHHRLLRAGADREHHDDRGHADHDAQQCQASAKAVDPHHAPGRAQRLVQFGEQGARRVGGVGRVRGREQRKWLWWRFDGRAPAVRHDAAVADLDHAARALRHLAVVRDEDHGVAGGGHLVEQRHHLFAAARIERAGGLVGQHDASAVHECTRDRHALLLATRQLVRPVAQPIAQAQPREQPACARGALGGRRAGVDGGHLDVLLRRLGGDQVVALEHEAEGLRRNRASASRSMPATSWPANR